MSVLTINKLTTSVGAEVVGVDPERLGTDDSLGAAVLDALEDNGVLVFHGLHLNPEAQVAFSQRLGEIDRSADGHHPVSGIYPITLDKTKNKAAEYLKATFDWHIDGCTPVHDECPQKATVLSALEVAARGGRPSSPTPTRPTIRSMKPRRSATGRLRVVHSLEASQRRVYPDSDARSAEPLGEPGQPTRTRWCGRTATAESPWYWALRRTTSSAMDRDEGARCLTELLAPPLPPDKVYRHKWSVGDTVIWDNQGVLHRAAPTTPTPPPHAAPTVLGDEPIQEERCLRVQCVPAGRTMISASLRLVA